MSERLSIAQIGALCIYATGMAVKLTTLRIPLDGSLLERAIALGQSWLFLAALALYLVLSALWVWILSFTPLSRAYPFVALAFILVPVLASIFFSEPISLRLAIGIGLIICGLVVVTG